MTKLLFNKMKPDETFETFKLDVIMNNEDINELFNNVELIKIAEFNFPHLIKTYSKDKLTYTAVKNDIDKMISTLIGAHIDLGLILILSKDFLFTCPLANPYCYEGENKDKPVFADPEMFLGLFCLPVIETEWPETVDREHVNFDLLEILSKSANI